MDPYSEKLLFQIQPYGKVLQKNANQQIIISWLVGLIGNTALTSWWDFNPTKAIVNELTVCVSISSLNPGYCPKCRMGRAQQSLKLHLKKQNN